MNPTMPSVSVIIPTFREAENLPLVIPAIAAALRTRGWAWEVIVVDDNSPDATPEVLESLSRSIPQLRWKIRTGERGLSSAVLCGMGMSRYEYLVCMDADLSHPPEKVPELVEKLTRCEGDFALGSRYVPGGVTEDWTAFRWLNSAVATWMCKPLAGTVRDPMSGFFAMRREAVANSEPLSPIGYKIALELMVKCRVRHVTEVPITFKNRQHGESKLTLKEQFRYLEHLSRLYDFKYPKGSARAKFLIASGCGAAACGAVVAGMAQWWNQGFPINMAAGLLAMILVTLVFFARYVNAQRDFIVMRHPYSEFTYISLAELITGWFFAVSTQGPMWVQGAVGIFMLLLVRYTLRKVFLHDIRGIRGERREGATVRVTFATAGVGTTAASA